MEEYEELLKMDGFNDCIVGVVEQFGRPPITCYDLEKVIAQLITESGMDEEEAREWWEYNMIGAYVGEETPCFLTLIEKD
jgi:hypothetical protein